MKRSHFHPYGRRMAVADIQANVVPTEQQRQAMESTVLRLALEPSSRTLYGRSVLNVARIANDLKMQGLTYRIHCLSRRC
jgi:hypothetical protein